MNLEIKPEDISIDYWGSKPVAAWNVNNQRGVKIIHLNTGIVVTCESEISQHRNKALAMEKLREKLAEYVPPKSEAKDDALKLAMILIDAMEYHEDLVEYDAWLLSKDVDLDKVRNACKAALGNKSDELTNKTCNLENKLERISHIVEGLGGSYEIHAIRKQLQEVLNDEQTN